jgi:hypothetical protein
MRIFNNYLFIILLLLGGFVNMLHSENFIPASNPNIQYFGRWDFSDSLHPKHSWPGVFVYAEFTGKSIGIRMADSINFYNVYIDGKFYSVLHGNKKGEADYKITDTLDNTNHSIKFSKRNIVFDAVFSFSGFILDDNATLISPPPKPKLRIEFIGNSYTAGESDEATVQELTWEERYPVTNIDKGFAVLIANHFNADYCTTCRSGCGMVCDWQGNFNGSVPKLFDRTLMESPEPKWNFYKWIPDLVVIALGLNDYSGLKNKDENVTEEKSAIFQKGYHQFIKILRTVYPGVKILAVAPYTEWIRSNVKQVVEEEKAEGNTDIYYAQFDYFPGGYVGYGHPTVETHKKMASQLIEAIDSLKIISISD